MCGLLGILPYNEFSPGLLKFLYHRGPDHQGKLEFPDVKLFLGHTRLSIIDLEPKGNQPMSLSDRYYIVFNGEIYNYKELKESILKDEKFKSNSDTEVILKLYQRFGCDTPKYLRGMFSFCIYDKRDKLLFLCRDRLGVKPLFYYKKDDVFAFSSELAPLVKAKGIDITLDNSAIIQYFTFGYISAPNTIYKYIRKIEPASYILYNVNNHEIAANNKYWKLNCKKFKEFKNEEDWTEIINEKLNESIKYRMVSDVPVGAFLSGGIDSTIVVSKMRELTNKEIKTFTIGFSNQEYDERKYAKKASETLDTNHYEKTVEINAIDIIPKLINAFGEPFSDSSAIPTFYVSQLASESVKVSLSGDGGDELFAGYTRYFEYLKFNKFNKKFRGFFSPFKPLISKYPEFMYGAGFLNRMPYSGLKLYQSMNSNFEVKDYKQLFRQEFIENISFDSSSYNNIFSDVDINEYSDLEKVQYVDINRYLPDDILTKVDRMSMLNSLESRDPLLDHELVELAFNVPDNIKIKNNSPKYLLKKILNTKFDNKFINRHKSGFAIPLKEWFSSDLKDFAFDYFESAKNNEFINYDYIIYLYRLHLKNKRDFSGKLYIILVFLIWYNQCKNISYS